MRKILIAIFVMVFLMGIISAGTPDPFGDHDGDHILNWKDNCYFVFNFFQLDSDGDGIGNCCDIHYVGSPEYCDISGGLCGDNFIDAGIGEQCDDGANNGIVCDNSISSCSYCTASCNLIYLTGPSSNDDEDHKKNKCDDDCDDDDDEERTFGYCVPNWKCSAWGECLEGAKFRNCEDTNNCAYAYDKPIEETGCEKTLFSLVKNEPNYLWILGLFIAIMLIVILIVVLINA